MFLGWSNFVFAPEVN